MILESEESAISRGAPILAEVIGFHTSSDGTHIAQPHSESIASCIKDALNSSGVSSSQIGYINAHATATPVGDLNEAQAISKVFGSKTPYVSSTKSMTGHKMWMGGASEIIYSV